MTPPPLAFSLQLKDARTSKDAAGGGDGGTGTGGKDTSSSSAIDIHAVGEYEGQPVLDVDLDDQQLDKAWRKPGMVWSVLLWVVAIQ